MTHNPLFWLFGRAAPDRVTSSLIVALLTTISFASPSWGATCVEPVNGDTATANNCPPDVQNTAVGIPDLLVDSVRVSTATPETDANFTISATVRNQGTEPSAATRLRYVRSDDATITADDAELEDDLVSALAPDASDAVETRRARINRAGAYWVGACVIEVRGEIETANNCSTGVSVTVSGAPDLIVAGVTVSTATPETNANFTISATVRNQGDKPSAATRLRYVRSDDATITADDIELEDDLVSALAPGGSDSVEIRRARINRVGAYWVGACVLTVRSEIETTNNCSTGVSVTVGGAPDLIVDSVRVSTATPETDANFTISATVRNQGTAPSAATRLRYVRSDDATITADDTEIEDDLVSALSPGGSDSVEIRRARINRAGTYWVGACVITVRSEIVTDNNCSSGVSVTVGGAPDLTVNGVTVSTATPETDTNFTISATVRNQGDKASAATRLRYVRSADESITADDAELEGDLVSALSPGASDSVENTQVRIDRAGTYWVGACVIEVTGELATGNNCSSAVSVTVSGAPDLTVDGVRVSTDTPETDANFTISATVRNQGDKPSAATRLRYVRSNDATITAADTEIEDDLVNELSPGGSDSVEIRRARIDRAGTYWVGACVIEVTGELETANNCSSGVSVTVGGAPDLTVDNVRVSTARLEPDANFTISATVRNQGDKPSAATRLRYVRSNDATITPADTELEDDLVGALSPGASASVENTRGRIDRAGTYWVGACVIEVTSELSTANNCSSGVPVTVGSPDLIIDSVNVSTPTVEPGVSFTIDATARNRGTMPSAATRLRYFRSNDATITTDDSQLATDSVDGLLPSAYSPKENAVVAVSVVGVYWVGACIDRVDGETATANNCSQGVRVAVGSPDLLVDSVDVSDATPNTGAPFTINATVRNQGVGAAGATTLRYFRSDDSTITTADTELATDPVGGLAAAASSAQSATVSIPIAGAFWVGACVGTVRDETIVANNCSSGVRVTAVGVPDLIINRVDVVADTTLETDASFTINATARNQGTAPAAATTLSYFYSNDSTITADDTELATDPVGRLAVDASSAQSAVVSIPVAGAYWVGVCVGTVRGETITNNNCSRGVPVNVSVLPDLLVDGVSVSDATLGTGASFTINATVRNQGPGAAAATTLRYFRSDDSTITTADTELATDPVVGLAVDASSTQSATVSIPEAGRYWIGACVGTVSSETATANNCSSGVPINVNVLPDLIVQDVGVSDNRPEPDESFTINATVRNQGTGAAAATTLRYFYSEDNRITATATELATAPVGGLAAAASSAQSATVSIPAPTAGIHWVGACIDSVNGETARANNCSRGVLVVVGSPDLIVDSINVPDARPEPGAPLTIEATVRNQGTRASIATTLRYFRSNDSTITADDIELDDDFPTAIPPGGFSAQSVTISVGEEATFWVGACVDPLSRETVTDNNCSSGVQVTIAVASPDLIVDSVAVADDRPEPGESFMIEATVQNQGNRPSAATTLRYVRSDDEIITPADRQLASDAVDALAAGGSSQQSTAVSIADAGIYWVGACVVPVLAEFVYDHRTTNNCSTGVQVNVNLLPDLIVDSVDVSDATPQAGASLMIEATVQNQGNRPSAATTLRYFRSDDSTITTADTELAIKPVGELAADASSAQSAAVLLRTAGTYWVGACVGRVRSETETANNCSTGTQVAVTASPDDNGISALPEIIWLLLEP